MCIGKGVGGPNQFQFGFPRKEWERREPPHHLNSWWVYFVTSHDVDLNYPCFVSPPPPYTRHTLYAIWYVMRDAICVPKTLHIPIARSAYSHMQNTFYFTQHTWKLMHTSIEKTCRITFSSHLISTFFSHLLFIHSFPPLLIFIWITFFLLYILSLFIMQSYLHSCHHIVSYYIASRSIQKYFTLLA